MTAKMINYQKNIKNSINQRTDRPQIDNDNDEQTTEIRL